MTQQHIIVVGAGIAGLTAAYRLQQSGQMVTVLEARSNTGGRMITIHWNGLAIDPGAEFVTGADKYLRQLVKELNVEDKLVNYSETQTGFNVTVMRDNRLHTVNFMSIASYLGWTGVSLKARLSMFKLIPYLVRYRQVNVYAPENAPGEDTIPMEEFFYNKISPEMFEYWVEPIMDVFCGYVPTDLSAKMLLLMLGNYLSQKLYTFEGGIAFLPNLLASKLNVQCNAQVNKINIRPDGSGATVAYQEEGIDHVLEADSVVVAVPGDMALGLFMEPRPAWQEFFPMVNYTRVGIVYHLMEGDDPVFNEGGIMFPRKEPWKLSALGWKRRPDGRVLAMSDLKAHLYDAAISDEELRQVITAEVTRAVPQFEGHIQDQMVFRWPRKVPTYRVGYLSALKKFKGEPQEKPVYFCGDYLYGPNAGAALACGWHCAERVLQDL